MNIFRVGGLAVATALLAVSTACASSADDGEPVASVPTRASDPDTAAVADTVNGADTVSEATPTTEPPNETATTKQIVTRSADAVGDGVTPDGVSSVQARITSIDGEVCEVCLWLAEDDVTRQRGLMGVTDLGAAVGMVFRWDEPRTGNFFMFQTPTPLSIAWFDEAGAHVGQADMEPCLVENSAVCERYTADSPYVLAVEVFGGQLDAIGIGPGSTVELLDLACA